MKSLLLRCKWRNSALLLLFLLFAHSSSARIKAVSLTCEDLTDPMAVGVSQPRLSWVDVADGKDKNQRQTAYQVQVASAKEKLLRGEADLWDSGLRRQDPGQQHRLLLAGQGVGQARQALPMERGGSFPYGPFALRLGGGMDWG